MPKLTNNLKSQVALLAVLVSAFAISAYADAVYTYTGNSFFSGGDPNAPTGLTRVTGSFAVTSPLSASQLLIFSPASVNFTDGVHTFNTVPANSFIVITDSSGNISKWQFSLSTACTLVDGVGCFSVTLATDNRSAVIDQVFADNSSFAQLWVADAGPPGTWTRSVTTASTPEPSSLVLLGAGLLSIAGVVRRKLRFSSRRDL